MLRETAARPMFLLKSEFGKYSSGSDETLGMGERTKLFALSAELSSRGESGTGDSDSEVDVDELAAEFMTELAAKSRLKASGLAVRRIRASAVSRLGRAGTFSEDASRMGLPDRLLVLLTFRLCNRLEGLVAVGDTRGEPGADGRGDMTVGEFAPGGREARVLTSRVCTWIEPVWSFSRSSTH